MFFISLTWLLLFLLLMSWGAGIYIIFIKLLGKRYQTTPNIFHFSWMGFAALIGFLQIYSIFFAIDKLAVIVVYIIALISALFSYKYFLQIAVRILDTPKRFKIIWIIGVIFIIIIVSYNASLPLRVYDTDLYHLNAVKWASKYSAIPGIVNLHSRLAFNSSFLLFAALKNHWVWKDKSVYMANSFLLFLISIQWFSCIVKLPIVRFKISHAFVIITSPLVIWCIFSGFISSLGTDFTAIFLILIIIFELLSIEFENRGDGKDYWNVMNRRNLFAWFMIISLASVLLSTKLNTIPVFAIILISSICFFILFNLSRNAKYICCRHLLAVYGLSAMIVLGFIGRNIILSGWLLYPFPYGNLHLDWSASQQQVNGLVTVMKNWSVIPGKGTHEVLGNGFFRWFIPWYKGFSKFSEAFVLLYTGVFGLLYMLLSNTTKMFRSLKSIPLFLSIAIGILSLFFWFFTLPEWRYGLIYFWVFGGASISPIIYLMIRSNSSGKMLVFCIVIFLIYIQGVLVPHITQKPKFFELPPSKSKEVIPITINNGQYPKLIICKPIKGDQCGNSPLPCSPYINENSNIELRVPGQIKSGFRRMH